MSFYVLDDRGLNGHLRKLLASQQGHALKKGSLTSKLARVSPESPQNPQTSAARLEKTCKKVARDCNPSLLYARCMLACQELEQEPCEVFIVSVSLSYRFSIEILSIANAQKYLSALMSAPVFAQGL
eukprot:1143704-Pelagomonas_calceolata.AAC.2